MVFVIAKHPLPWDDIIKHYGRSSEWTSLIDTGPGAAERNTAFNVY